MSSSLKQIEKQLAAIEQSSQVLANELHHNFLNYLKSLGLAVKKQLILASYYLCTQGYPDAFLSLSFKERQELQSAIRQNALNAIQDLSILLTLTLRFQADLANRIETDDIEDDMEDDIEDDMEDDIEDDDDLDYLEDFLDETEAEAELDESNLDRNPAAAEPLQAGLVLKTPHRVSQWHKTLEQGIQEILRTVSRRTNKDLQSYKILPKNLPEIPDILLGIGLKNSRYAEPTGNLPNLANVTVEIGDDSESEKSRIREQKSPETMSLLKIYLRLSDIEFADPLLMARRNQIRELSHRLDSLLREYEKKQQERMTAEAEAAWRSSWFEA